MQGVWVRSLVGELDPACMPQLRVHMLQLKRPRTPKRSRVPQVRPGIAKINKINNYLKKRRSRRNNIWVQGRFCLWKTSLIMVHIQEENGEFSAQGIILRQEKQPVRKMDPRPWFKCVKWGPMKISAPIVEWLWHWMEVTKRLCVCVCKYTCIHTQMHVSKLYLQT